MPLVFSFFHDDVQENSRTEEENRKIGLVPIDTQRGVIWANPLNSERVLEKFGRPLISPPPLQNNVLGFSPPPLNIVQGPPPLPLLESEQGGPPPPKGGSALAQLLKGGPPPLRGGPLPPLGIVKKAPVKNEVSTEDNKSSAVPKEQMDTFVEGMVDQSDEVGFPVYSVCDNNSFHTSGYVWGYYAALMVKKLRLKPGPIAVINFDSHKDAGKPGSRIVASDRWGDILAKQMSDIGFPACYLSAFNKVKRAMVAGTTTAYFNSYPDSGIESPGCVIPLGDSNAKQKMDVIRQLFRDFWKKVNAHFIEVCKEPIKYVFFTIDRDVLNDSYTQWGNGTIRNADQLVELMEAVLEPLNILRGSDEPHAQLIGFDVTGLPETKNYHIDEPSTGTYGPPAVVWSKLAQELYHAFDFVHSRVLDARRSISVSHVFFFSGSISYMFLDGSEPPNFNCWHYVAYTAQRLKLLLGCTNAYYRDGWKFLLCQQSGFIYDAAWKRFTLYQPEKALVPCKLEEIEHLAEKAALVEEKMKPQLGEGLPLGGFACTAGVSDFDRLAKEKRKVPFDDMVKLINLFAPPEH